MQIVLFEPIFYARKEQIAIRFENDKILNHVVKQINGARWSQTHSCWYLPLSKETCREAYHALSGKAEIELDPLKSYLEKRKKISALQVLSGKKGTMKPGVLSTYFISDENMQELEAMVQALHLKAYSKNTISLYKTEMQVLMRLLRGMPVKQLKDEHIKSYILWLLKTKRYSEFKVHTSINALKFYYEQVLHQPKMFLDIPRPKKPQQLPTVYSGNQVSKLINSKENCKT